MGWSTTDAGGREHDDVMPLKGYVQERTWTMNLNMNAIYLRFCIVVCSLHITKMKLAQHKQKVMWNQELWHWVYHSVIYMHNVCLDIGFISNHHYIILPHGGDVVPANRQLSQPHCIACRPTGRYKNKHQIYNRCPFIFKCRHFSFSLVFLHYHGRLFINNINTVLPAVLQSRSTSLPVGYIVSVQIMLVVWMI